MFSQQTGVNAHRHIEPLSIAKVLKTAVHQWVDTNLSVLVLTDSVCHA